MNLKEILDRVGQMVEKDNGADLPNLSSMELSGILSKVIAEAYDELPGGAYENLMMVAACLMKEHVSAVEQDILSVRKVYRRPGG